MLVDSREITNCLKNRTSGKKGASLIMTDLFDPVFSHREEEPVTKKSYQVFKLLNIEKLGIAYKVVQLPFGDYIFPVIKEDGRRVVKIWERKTLTDLMGSFAGSVEVGSGKKSKKRLDVQLKDDVVLGEEYYDEVEVNLLIEDYYECRFDFSENNWGVWIPTWKKYKEDKLDREKKPYWMSMGYSRRAMHPNSILGKIRSLEERGIKISEDEYKPINVIKCGGAQHAYKTLLDEILPSKDVKTKGVRATRRKAKDMKISENQRFLLEGLPGFGGGMAQKTLEIHQRPIDFFNKLVAANEPKELGIPRFGTRQFEPSKKVLMENYIEMLEKEKEHTSLPRSLVRFLYFHLQICQRV